MSVVKRTPSLYVAIGICLLLLGTVFKFAPWQNAEKEGKLIAWDVTSYYGYLPATFIERDLTLSFVSLDSSFYHQQQMYWPETAPNGNKVIKTTMGMSLLYAPFFGIAKTIDDDHSKHRGFSQTFEFWLTLSNLFYTFLGVFFLRSFLIRHFDNDIVNYVLISLYLGTNLLYYITIEPLMPHAYNFALVACFIYLTDKWHLKKAIGNSLLLGLIIGLITLIRPVNGIVVIFFILYQFDTIKNRIRVFASHWKLLLIITTTGFAVILPQLIYWKIHTGHMVFNSYPGERFFFGSPHILDGLFSYRKGWLLYTPMMLFALIGLFLRSKLRLSLIFTILPAIYVMFSWWNWWYGGSFGCRPIIDLYPILAIGLAQLFSLLKQQTALLKWTGVITIGLLIPFNIFQTLQKKSDAIHWEAMTKEAYWHNFFHRYPQPGLDEKLKSPDIEAAKAGKEN